MAVLLYLCFAGLLAQSLAQVRTSGACPQLKSIPNFNDTQILGDWFEWARVDSYYQTDHACSTLTYYRGDDGYMVEHYDALIRYSGGTTTWEGRLVHHDGQPPAVYEMVFSKYASDKSFTATFIAANLEQWVILHGCREEGKEALQFVWIWTKDYHVEQQYQTEISSALGSTDIAAKDIMIVDQTHCPNHL